MVFTEGPCACGREHKVAVDVRIGAGVIHAVPELVKALGCTRPFLVADGNTFAAAGETLVGLLREARIDCSCYCYADSHLEPDERAVGAAAMAFRPEYDILIGVGSGVINDICKILSNITGRKYIIVATAPSMDGYASASSSMTVAGLKTSLPSRLPDVIVGDTDVLKNAPAHMLKAGLGDMLAKYVSLVEWKIANLITGEYYCPRVAELMASALEKCVCHADGLLRREDASVEAVFEGLVIGGIAMSYAGVSRPASGVEHYFSHVWDMRGVEYGAAVELHGIQCAVGTLLAVKLYEKLVTLEPREDRARAFVNAFSWETWQQELRALLGCGAEAMIAGELREHKYDKSTHPARLCRILEHWQEICGIIRRDLPAYSQLEALMKRLDMPMTPEAMGMEPGCGARTFRATKDIRDKYVLSRLAWDLGVLEELCEVL